MNNDNNSSCKDRAIKVTVDDRERRFGVVKALAAMDGVAVEIKRLPLGDYLITNDLLAERKTVFDFVYSVADGRLFRQAYRLAVSDYRTCFILEGDFSIIDRCGLSRNAFLGAVITVSLVFNLPILRSRSPEETAWLLFTAGGQLARRKTHRPRHIPRKRGSRVRIQSQMLQAIPDIGPSKANAVLDEFGTMRSLANATLDDLRAVHGIGPKIAKRIHWAFGGS